MLRYSEFNVLNSKHGILTLAMVSLCVCSKWDGVGMRGGEVIRSLLLQIKFHNVVTYNYVTN